MDNDFSKNLSIFLSKNGYDEVPVNNKKVLKTLYEIMYQTRLDEDYADLCHSKGTDGITQDDYVEKIKNLQINLIDAQYFSSNIKGIIKEERKLRFKNFTKKLFKK